MKMLVRFLLAIFLASSVVSQADHTSEDRMLFARSRLKLVLCSARDNLMDLSIAEPPNQFDTWEGFLGPGTVEWTMADRKDAFETYLAWLGEADMAASDGMEKELARIAISQCGALSFTNAVPALKSIGLNPNGLHRWDAISLAVTLSPLDTNLVGFVETVMTNTTAFTPQEREAACAQLAKKLLSECVTNMVNVTTTRQATEMLYRNRKVDTAGSIMLDKLFCEKYNGYASSSNRLDYALYVVNFPDDFPYYRQRFMTVTNQLLSSGQPLQWINIGGTNE